jgi:hypothetical protein
VTALVSVLTVLVVLMALLVAGLLRSHAEILRRLDGEGGEAGGADGGLARREDAPARAGGEEAPDVVGTTLAGEPVQAGLGGTPTLLAFLTSGCSVCGELWEGLRSPPALPDGMRVVVVAKDASHESPSRLALLRPRRADGTGGGRGRGDDVGRGRVARRRRAARRRGGQRRASPSAARRGGARGRGSRPRPPEPVRPGGRVTAIAWAGVALAVLAGLRSAWSP